MAKKIQCFGIVQGVFYRVSTKERADKLGLKGWVKNAPNGSVEIHAQGNQTAIDELISWCQKGPMLAKVTRVVCENAPDEGFESFEIRRS